MHTEMKRQVNIRSRIWVDINDTPFVGGGRVVLLEQILKHGSITKGAAAINMSYRKAWQLVEDMNKISKKPVVKKRLGGAKGGGAEVTDEGKNIIKQFHVLQKDVEAYLQVKLKDLKI